MQGKPPRTERPIPGKVRIVVVFQGFQEVGGIRSVWGTLAGNDGTADGIPSGPPYGGMKNYLCNHITGPGSMQLFVQLADDASTTLDDSTTFAPDESNTVTAKVRPRTAEVEVEEKSEFSAKAKAEVSFKTQFGGEIPLRVVLAKVEEVVNAGVGGEVAGGQTTTKKYKYIVLRKGLQFG